MTAHPQQRRTLIVNRALQQKMIMAYSGPTTFVLCFATACMAYFCTRLATEARQAGAELDGVTPVLVTACVFMVAATASVVVSAVRFSHRVAGPMVAIDRTLSEIERSSECGPDDNHTPPRVKLREADYLHPVAERINRFLDHLDTRTAEPTPDLIAQLDRIDTASRSSDPKLPSRQEQPAGRDQATSAS